MKKRIITVIVAAAALLTLTASPAAAQPTFDSAGGVLVRHDDGYIITGTLRAADAQVVGTLHGTLTELTTGFNSCPFIGTLSALCFPGPARRVDVQPARRRHHAELPRNNLRRPGQ